ncbi:hypothetical protein [Ornithinimicrobium tianjinense]|uniref:Helicase n=1 Tax=Ornithinimicrobium tianjinense TaxID=1195761 RepID=A0A917F8C1_9MICO|nr:hypothetical protein [Ornithinimicrobium tianjinense]GGF55171.1 hypothetical protein GCM10011366_23840 [Ornithinimicrobium tianjinense]
MREAERDPITIEVGGLCREELRRALTRAGVQLNVHAETLLEHRDFDHVSASTLTVVRRTVSELGLVDGGTLGQVLDAASALGLEPSPLVTAPYLRLATLDQPEAPDSVLSAGRPPTGAVHVASVPVSPDIEHPKGFYLRVVDGEPWLRGYRCDDDYEWGPEAEVALVRPSGRRT